MQAALIIYVCTFGCGLCTQNRCTNYINEICVHTHIHTICSQRVPSGLGGEQTSIRLSSEFSEHLGRGTCVCAYSVPTYPQIQ